MAKKTKLPPVEVQSEELGPCHFRLRVQVPQARVQAEFDHAIQSASRGVKVPGFRPGKAPAALIRGMLGDSVGQEAKDHLFEHVVQEALVKSGLQPLRLLDFDPSQHEVDEEQELEFDIELETTPTVELPKWEEVRVESQSTEATEEQIEQAIQSLARDHVRFDEVEDGAVDDEHVALANLQFRRGDEKGPTAEGLHLGPGSPLYGADPEAYDEAMRGVRAGESRTLAIEFKEGFEKEEWVGSSGEVDLEVQQIVKPRPATLEELVGDLKFDSEEELRDKVRQQLALQNEVAERDRLAYEALEEMGRMRPFALPQRLVDEEIEATMKSQAERLQKQGGVAEEEARQKVEEAREQFAQDSERRLRHYFLVRKVAATERIRVGDSDLDRAYRDLATRHQADAKSVRAYYEEQGLDGQLRTDILERKVRAKIAGIVQKHNPAPEPAAAASVESEAPSE